MRVLHAQLREHDAIAQAVGQLADRARLVRAAQAEAAELRAPRLDVLVGVLFIVERLEVFDRGLFVRELVGRVLRVLGELETDVMRDGTFTGLESTGDEVEEGRLAGTVLTDDGHTRVHAGVGHWDEHRS